MPFLIDLVVAFLAADGTGYLQPGFTTLCRRSDCLPITKESLCARKLAENLSRQGQGPDTCLPYVYSQNLSELSATFVLMLNTFFSRGTFFTESRAATQETSHKIVWLVRHTYEHSPSTKCNNGVNEELCLKILRDVGYSLPELRAKLGKDKLYVDPYSLSGRDTYNIV